MSLVTLKRKCRLTFSHQKKTQMSGDSKATWVNHWVKYRLCKSQKQFFGRYYHYVYGPVKFVSEICISRKCGYVSGITLCLALVYEWSRSGRKLNLKYKCANQDYNEVVETMLRGKFDKAFRENGESMSLGVAQFDRKGFDFLLELLLRGFKWTDYNFFRLQLQGLFNEGLHQSVLLPTGDMNLLNLFIKLFVKILISGTLVGEICNTKLNVEIFGNNMESDGQSLGEPFSSLQFCESPVNLNVLKAQFHSSNKGDFTYVMCLENWIERIIGNASKLSVRQATKGSGKSEFLILDQETNFQQRVSYLENATGLLKNNFGLSFASIALYYGDYKHKQLKFGLVLGLCVYISRMQPEHEYVIGSYMNQFYNPNCGVKWVRVVHVYNQPSNSSIEVIGFLIAVLELSHGRYDNSTWFLLLNLCSVLSTIDSNIFVIAVTKNRKDKQVLTLSHFGMAWPFNALSFDFDLRTCKPIEQVMVVDYALAILMKERLNSTLSFNIYTAMLPKEFYIGSSFGAVEVMGVKNAFLLDKVLTVETLIKSFSVHNFSSEAFEVNCEMISYSLQLGINPCAVTDNCLFKGFEMENLYELIINDLYKFIGQQCSMLWIISASVKPDLKFLFRVAKNFKPTGNLLSNTLYDVLGVTLITAISFNKKRKTILVMSNPVHEPCKTTCVQVLIEASKTLRLVEDDITKLEGLFDNGPMYFPHSKSASTSLRNFLQLSLEHSEQVKVFLSC